MKKTYTKPEIMFEDFTLTTNIAAGCEALTTTATLRACGLDYSGIQIFMEGQTGCTDEQVTNVGGDGKWQHICYHIPDGFNVFNS